MTATTKVEGIDPLVAAHSVAYEGNIDKAKISQLLQSVGVDLTHPLLASFVLATFDLLAVVDLAGALPEELDLGAAAAAFHTFTSDQPAEVREVQSRVLKTICEAGVPLSQRRLDLLQSLLASG